ncbi:MAG: TonB-dependent receptor domain-containing protein [Erythrobacter sp.]|uniref:TonB-dependent receptor domain-containing protein n=1 Tax=Erythrobacter sp. TaxID=1042 RepID=UPI003A8B40D3
MKTAILASVAMPLASQAHAQSADRVDVNTTQEKPENLIVVTGTQIKGAQIDDVLPVTTLDQKDIETTGAVSGDELFRSIPQAGAVNFQDNKTSGGINDARGDVASLNLRDLGTGNTLLLINGRRMVLNPGFQTELLVPVVSPNTNNIAPSSVRRLEVLRDGASAIYGADAVGGVVNTILRSNRNGGTATASYGFAEETSQYEFNVGGGYGFDFNDGRSNITFYADYFKTNQVLATERDFSARGDQRPLVEGTPFEGDVNFRNISSSAPWALFRASQRISEIRDDDFHIQPDYITDCRLDLGNGLCADNGSTSLDPEIRYEFWPDRDLFSERDRLNLTALLTHEFSDTVEFYGEAQFYRFESKRQREQGRILGGQEIGINADAYYNPFGPLLRADGSVNTSRVPGLSNVPAEGTSLVLIDIRPVDVGPRMTTVTGDTYRLLGGLRGELGKWDFDTAVLYSRARVDDTTRNRVSLTALQEAINRTTPDAYNPFNGGCLDNPMFGDCTPSNAATLDDIRIEVFRKGETELFLTDFKLSRDDLITLPGGNLGVAVGVEFRNESFVDDRDPRLDGTITFNNAVNGDFYGGDVLSNSPTPDTSGSRDVYSAWAEAFVPIVSDDMDIPLVQSLDLQLAGRFESFSDAGETFVPRVAASWTITDGLLLRGAWSQGFRAPNLVQVNDIGVQRSNDFDDIVRCQAQVEKNIIASLDNCVSSSITNFRSGSEELKPENTESINLGIVLSPSFIPGLTFTADYWEIEQKGIVGLFGPANQIALDLLLRSQGSFNPAVVRLAADADTNTLFAGTSLSPAGEIDFITDNYANLDRRKTAGFDFGIYYDLSGTPIGDFRFRFNAARLDRFFQSPGDLGQILLDAVDAGNLPNDVQVSGIGDLLEEDGRPKWQFSSSMNWSSGGWDVGLFGRYVGKFFDSSVTQDDDGSLFEVKPWFTTNLSVAYTFENDSIFDGSRIRFRVTNLFNQDPPLADESFGFYGEYHSAKGRFFSLDWRQNF